MDRDAIRGRIRNLLAEIAEDDDLVLTDETTARDVPSWDSLTHLRLLVGIEGEFDIRFAASELTSANNVGQLVDLVAAKI